MAQLDSPAEAAEPQGAPAPAPAAPSRLAGGWHALRTLPRLVWLLGLASLLNDVSSEAIFPLLPLFLAGLGAPMAFLGLIEGSATALGSVIKVVSGRLADRGPRRVLVV